MGVTFISYFLYLILIILIIWILIQKSIKETYIPEKYDINENNDYSIITWNIQKFPWSLKSFKNNNIYNIIKSHSIILLQECFDETYESLESCFPEYYICRGNLKGINVMNSGLVILSKFPIENIHFYQYKNYNPFSFELFSEKGYLSASIKIKNKKIRIINTHLQSSDFERYDKNAMLQLNELFQYINHLSLQKINFIVGGDFNIDIKDFFNLSNISNIKQVFYPKKPTIYIDFSTAKTSSTKKQDYEPLIFDYFLSNINMKNPLTISSEYSDHNPVLSFFTGL